MDKKLVTYELRRHGEDEVEFYDIEDLLFALTDAGFQVERHFYEDGEFSAKEIQETLEKEGLHALPISIMDGEISIKGRYPTVDEIAHYFGVEITYEADEDCLAGDGCCCCCGGDHQEDPEYEHSHECCCHDHRAHDDNECCCSNNRDATEHECSCCHHEE